jgi:hypothetical protein
MRESKSFTSEMVSVPARASDSVYEDALLSIRVMTVPAITEVVCDVPFGIPIVPLFVSVPLTKTLKPLVNRVTLASTVRFS